MEIKAMKHAIIEQKVLGMVSTNTWFLKNKETGALLIIDPADTSGRCNPFRNN